MSSIFLGLVSKDTVWGHHWGGPHSRSCLRKLCPRGAFRSEYRQEDAVPTPALAAAAAAACTCRERTVAPVAKGNGELVHLPPDFDEALEAVQHASSKLQLVEVKAAEEDKERTVTPELMQVVGGIRGCGCA